jgi:type IV secretion system protein VirD4
MKANRFLLAVLQVAIMTATVFAMTGIETWLVRFANTEAARLTLGRVGIAAPYVSAAALGLVILFASAGSASIRAAGWGTVAGNVVVILIAAARELTRLSAVTMQVPVDQSVLNFMDPATVIGAAAALMAGCFALRVALVGNAAFGRAGPKRISGKRALHGEANRMNMRDAARWIGLRRNGSRFSLGREFRTVYGYTKPSAPLWNFSVAIAIRCVVELCSQIEGPALGRSLSMG